MLPAEIKVDAVLLLMGKVDHRVDCVGSIALGQPLPSSWWSVFPMWGMPCHYTSFVDPAAVAGSLGSCWFLGFLFRLVIV